MYRADAEACGKVVREILSNAKPKVWAHLDDPDGYVKWVATWGAHWAAAVLRMESSA
jgi:hypothetical protein